MIVGTKPKRLITKTEPATTFVLQNKDAAATVRLHENEWDISEALEIAALSTSSPIDWRGGELWISATADNVEVRRLASQPGRAAQQQQGSSGSGGGSGGSGGGDGGGLGGGGGEGGGDGGDGGGFDGPGGAIALS